MFYIGLALLSLFSTISAMELVKQQDWISLKALTRMEGYHFAKKRGDMISLNQSAAKLIQVLDEKCQEGSFPCEIRKHIAFLIKRDIYKTNQIYKAHKCQFVRYGKYWSWFEGDSACALSLCVDVNNDQLFIGLKNGKVLVSDIATKKCKTYLDCGPYPERMHISEDRLLIVEKSLESNMVYDCSSYKLVGQNVTIENENKCELYLPQSELTLKWWIESDGIVLDLQDSMENSLAHINCEGVTNATLRCIAIDPRNDTLYLGSNDFTAVMSPLFNYKEAMQESDLLSLATVSHDVSVDSHEVIKRSGDGCTIL